MRYFWLLVCLTAGTLAQAYNETVASIAYNPSRLGAYDYLKVNNIKLKSGLRAVGNTTEINLFGNIAINDSRSTNHQDINNEDSRNTITNIKPLSNYALDADNHTFCTSGRSWVQNSRACSGETTLTANTLMGMETHGFAYNGTDNLSNGQLIPNVYMYGGQIDTISNGAFSRIKNIKRTNGSSVEEYSPDELILHTTDIRGIDSSYIKITEQLKLGKVALSISSGLTNCTGNNYAWVERVTDNHRKVKILACK